MNEFASNIRDHIIHELFNKDIVRLSDRLDDLIQQNASLGNPVEGFLFSGTFWTKLPNHERIKANKKLLHPDLHEDGKQFVEDLTIMSKDKTRLTQGLHLILRDCRSNQDVRDALPDICTSVLPAEAATLPRTRKEGWTVRNSPLQFEQYKTTSELLLFYVSNRLIY